jgi:potassium-transporting ATPase KdpC subunit
MREHVRPPLVLLSALTLLTGVAYPWAVTGFAQVVFPRQANGSLVRKNGRVIGSSLIGQAWDDPRYFWGRPSATGPMPCNADASSGSNLGPTNPALREAVEGRIRTLREADPGNDAPVPVDLVTSSGSGLDPHVSPAAALYQVPRIARLRGRPEREIRALVERHVEPRTLGLWGEPRVNVLGLNLALDAAR